MTETPKTPAREVEIVKPDYQPSAAELAEDGRVNATFDEAVDALTKPVSIRYINRLARGDERGEPACRGASARPSPRQHDQPLRPPRRRDAGRGRRTGGGDHRRRDALAAEQAALSRDVAGRVIRPIAYTQTANLHIHTMDIFDNHMKSFRKGVHSAALSGTLRPL